MWHNVVPILLLLLQPFAASDNNNNCNYTLHATLQRSWEEQRFETLLLLQQSKCSGHQIEQTAAAAGNWPLLRFNAESNFYLRRTQSTQMLALICLTGNQQLDLPLWQALARNLFNMRHVRLLLWLQQPEAESLHCDGNHCAPRQKLLQDLAAVTQKFRFSNALLLLPTGHAYQLQPYAGNKWLKLEGDEGPIFTRNFNYQRLTAYTLPDQISSRSLVYRDKRTNELRMVGFVARLIQEFAAVHNISLQWQRQVAIGEQLSLILLRNMTLNGTLNLPITLCGYELSSERGVFTYPYDTSNWFVMVPCARELPTADVYLLLFSWEKLALLMGCYCIFALLDTCFGYLLMRQHWDWTNLVFNERMISGLIGQPFKLWADSKLSPRVTHAQLFLVGLTISTLFAAHLKTMLTKPPTERRISNFNELRDSKLSVYFEDGERFYLNLMLTGSRLDPIKSKIQYLKTNEFYARRRALNKSQALSMTSIEWYIIKRQQELFHQPTVCLYPDLIFRFNLLMSVPLQANSIFEEPLNRFIHRIHASGLKQYWKQESLRALIALGQISLKDPYPYEPFHDFKVADLLWVWLSLFLGLSLAFLFFLCELIVYRLSGK